MASIFYVGCDNVIVLNQLTDENGDVVANATVVGVLYVGSTAVANGTINFTPVPGVNGDYESLIPAAIALVENKTYSLYITATFASGSIAEFRINRPAKVLDI